MSRAEYDEQERIAVGIETAITGLRRNSKDQLPEMGAADQEGAYREFVDQLVENAKIEIIREDLLDD